MTQENQGNGKTDMDRIHYQRMQETYDHGIKLKNRPGDGYQRGRSQKAP
jgi:hypothetical protein